MIGGLGKAERSTQSRLLRRRGPPVAGGNSLDEFTQALKDWELFYSTVALASVTLAGLLFVSVSLRQAHGDGTADGSVMRLARGSFGDFLYVLMLGLVFLVPHQAPIGLSVALFVLGLSRAIGTARQLRALLGDDTEEGIGLEALRRIALPLLASLGLIVVGVEILRNDMVSIYGLVIVVAMLLTTASWNAWLILVAEKPG
jgi:hypothetical protein